MTEVRKKLYEKLLGKEWVKLLGEDILQECEKIMGILSRHKDSYTIYPAQENIFKAFKLCPPSKLVVVILGQDPYFNGEATGLCFESKDSKPPSLKNIEQEMLEDVGGGTLGEHLPEQGVLLLNTALTVFKGQPNSHKTLWKNFTSKVIEVLKSEFFNYLIWTCWGGQAIDLVHPNENKTQFLIASSHPSPLGCTKMCKGFGSFKGSKPFSKINKILKHDSTFPNHAVAPILWDATPKSREL